MELGHETEIELEVELPSPAGEVLVELAPQPLERLGGAQHARPVETRERFEVMLRLGVEADPAQAAIGHADEQRADWRVLENVEGGVEQVGRSRRGAKALVERRGKRLGHRCSFRSRRTPADAACRAAASLEPSAAPISS